MKDIVSHILLLGSLILSGGVGIKAQCQDLKDLSSGYPCLKYMSCDSLEVVDLLRGDCGSNDVLYFARHFLGRPYVAHTLEVCDPECLVVNLRELDCTTFVETVVALVLTKRQRSDRFADFCTNLERIRYKNGYRDGYCSRLHYFSWWMKDNIARGNVVRVVDTLNYTKPLFVQNNFMSTHPKYYKALSRHPEWIKIISKEEQQNNGSLGAYLEESTKGWNNMKNIQDGDIVAIVTNKAGLDFSHLGFAIWGKDGELHLLNASSLTHTVVEYKMTLNEYLLRSPSRIGVVFLRIK